MKLRLGPLRLLLGTVDSGVQVCDINEVNILPFMGRFSSILFPLAFIVSFGINDKELMRSSIVHCVLVSHSSLSSSSSVDNPAGHNCDHRHFISFT